jgi:hypothetical protein
MYLQLYTGHPAGCICISTWGEREISTTRGTIGAGIGVCGKISNIFLCRRWDAHIRFCR